MIIKDMKVKGELMRDKSRAIKISDIQNYKSEFLIVVL